MINWTVSPEIFQLGPFHIRYYGVLFALAFIAGYQIEQYIFKNEHKNPDDVNDLVWYMVLGTIAGARLGHCLFYGAGFYLTHPLEILKVWEGGLASHGAAIGILIAIYFYSRKKKDQTYLWTMDRVVIPVALAGCFIRLGNLFNSEIIGTPSNLPWAFKFPNALAPDGALLPRHPAQLYESIAYLLVFIFMFYLYRKKKGLIAEGYFLGLFLILVFSFRFFVEFIKESQEPFENGMLLNMGQLLSIPLVILGVWLVLRSDRHARINNNKYMPKRKNK